MKTIEIIKPSETLINKICYLEREDLERSEGETFPDIWRIDRAAQSCILHQNVVHIAGLSRFWEDAKGEKRYLFEQYMEDLMVGLHGMRVPFCFIIQGVADGIHVAFGVPEACDMDKSFVKGAVMASFPEVQVRETSGIELLSYINNLPYCGMLTGIPTDKMRGESFPVEQIERLVRGMYGERWVLLVIAEPLEAAPVSQALVTIAEEIRATQNTVLLKGTVDESNRLALHYIEMLEATLERLKIAKNEGMWGVRTYLFTQRNDGLSKGLALLKAIFSGKGSIPQPVRILHCDRQSEAKGHENCAFDSTTFLNSKELSTLVQFPREEMPGFEVKEYTRFDVSLAMKKAEDSVAVGAVIDRGLKTGGWFELRPEDFVKHGLIVGVTGSGKTNTCFYMLDQLWKQHKVPFLVIEPAKCEYRNLLKVKGFRDLRIFTLGDETVAPFRLNPFEIQPGVHVQTHIDHLKSVFYASFILFAPMPYVLEQSIHEVYEDRGWDLARNENSRGIGPYSFPTLTDLFIKVGEVVENLGYDDRISKDVLAGLRTRINSLRIGGKGLMLDTRMSIGMEQVLNQPAILEMKQIGDDDEKAFLIGLILVRLYEYYESLVKLGALDFKTRLRHVTLIEEAHRILKNVPTEKMGEETSNIKGKAVETFCNILSEIRAYGEGVLIADQIPTKLSPDAVKNTNLKILHRIVAADDRDIMASAMNITEDQKRRIASLGCGEAAVYAEGADRPYLVKVPGYKGKFAKAMLSEKELKDHMYGAFFQQFPELFYRYQGCDPCTSKKPCESIRGMVRKSIQDDDFEREFCRFFLGAISNKAIILDTCKELERAILGKARFSNNDQAKGISYCALLHTMELNLDKRGAFHSMRFDDITLLKAKLVPLFHEMVNRRGTVPDNELFASLDEPLDDCFYLYRELCRKEIGPFWLCRHCSDICLFGFDVRHIANDPGTNRNFALVLQEKEWTMLLSKVARFCRIVAPRITSSNDESVLQKAALCYAAHKTTAAHFDISDQDRIAGFILGIESPDEKQGDAANKE